MERDSVARGALERGALLGGLWMRGPLVRRVAAPAVALGLAVSAAVVVALGLDLDPGSAAGLAIGTGILLLALGVYMRYVTAMRAEPAQAVVHDAVQVGSVVQQCPVTGAVVATAPPPAPAPGDAVQVAAREFLELYYSENPGKGKLEPRLDAVLAEIDATGTYWHTPDELAFGARVAWRNNKRCIGRLYWRSLQVRDLRTVYDGRSVALECFEHLRTAYNGGKIRPTISIFPPETPSRPAPRIWNEQLIRYAGYEQSSGRPLGDPRYRDFTTKLMQRGWRPPDRPGAFDILPLVVETAEDGVRMFQLPADAVHEVALEHPEFRWFAGLGLRWHAVPVISNNRLEIGGVSYPAAPFNGWYMGAEIGARNFGDTERYDLVPVVAERMGLDTSHEATLWRDQALIEINRAVLHSFDLAGVTVTDHHTESRRFLIHLEKEERAGRTCPADWSWIVPPLSGSQTPVFHRYYDTETRTPNFFTDPEATTRSLHALPPAFP